jgi:predicted nucleic acid-binding protein
LSAPGVARCVLDNTVVSSLHRAGALGRLLRLWPGRWVLPVAVREEAAAWWDQGSRVVAILDALAVETVIEVQTIEPLTDGPLYAQLRRTLGGGESAAIVLAHRLSLTAALDDRQARQRCAALVPPVPCVSTEGLLGEAVREGLLTRRDAEAIWAATGITDPRRGVD